MKKFLLIGLCLVFLSGCLSACSLAITKTDKTGLVSTTGVSLAFDMAAVNGLAPLIATLNTKPVVTPTPTPTPTPIPVPDPIPPTPIPQPQPTNFIVWDGSKVAVQMEQQGFVGNGTEPEFALFSTYGNHNWGYKGDENELPSAQILWSQRDQIKSWFTSYVANIGNQLKNNSVSKALLIVNDANDLGGCFMVNPIKDQLLGMGVNVGQLTDGQVYSPSSHRKNLKIKVKK